MKRRKPVTIKDVAKEARVSPTTVSYVLNKTKLVSKETQIKVIEAIKRLNYQPNVVARSLRSKKTNTVGLVICDLKNPFFAEVLQGIESYLGKKDYTILVIDTNYDPEKEEEAIKTLLGKQVDGMIVVLGRDNAEYLSLLDDWNIPVVFLDKKAEGKKNADAVLVNNKEGSKRLIEHVLSLGHRRIGIIAGPLNTTTGRERLEGYLEALSNFSLPRDEILIKIGDFRKESGYRLALELLDLPSLPGVIYACNNLMGLGAMEAIRERGFRIPEEVGLVIFDDLPWFKFVNPPLTVVSQPSFQLGEAAGKLLFEQMRKGRKKPKEIVLSARLEVRESVGESRKGTGLILK